MKKRGKIVDVDELARIRRNQGLSGLKVLAQHNKADLKVKLDPDVEIRISPVKAGMLPPNASQIARTLLALSTYGDGGGSVRWPIPAKMAPCFETPQTLQMRSLGSRRLVKPRSTS